MPESSEESSDECDGTVYHQNHINNSEFVKDSVHSASSLSLKEYYQELSKRSSDSPSECSSDEEELNSSDVS